MIFSKILSYYSSTDVNILDIVRFAAVFNFLQVAMVNFFFQLPNRTLTRAMFSVACRSCLWADVLKKASWRGHRIGVGVCWPQNPCVLPFPVLSDMGKAPIFLEPNLLIYKMGLTLSFLSTSYCHHESQIGKCAY